jgi:hypothetical protein
MQRGSFHKLRVIKLVNKFPSFYGIRRLVTMFTTGYQCSLSQARLIQFITAHPTS